MDLKLHPRIATEAPSTSLRVWVGAFNTTAAPALDWTLDGQPAQPTTMRPIQSARPAELLPPNTAPETISRAFAGVYEFTGLAPATRHEIRVSAGNVSDAISMNTLPVEVPAVSNQYLNVLLVSCFHYAEDTNGMASRIAASLTGSLKPHITLFAGDQVYLDLPTLANFPDDKIWLAKKFEDDYVRNWSDSNAYARVMGLAPSVAIPDDHEFWNNYPHVSAMIQNSFSKEGRDRWTEAARAGFEAFQMAAPQAMGEPVMFDIPPLSFFVADTRSHKEEDRSVTLDENTHRKLDEWVNKVIADGRFGVFVSGQSLFGEPAGAIGNVTDFELPNYGDYDQMMRTLSRLADAGRPLLCLTGDVHWGRVTSAVDTKKWRTALYEVISSPTSLVSFAGADQVKRARAFLGGLFGTKNPWPRHADADPPAAFVAANALQGRFISKQIHAQKGNHLALLRFNQSGGGLDLRVIYWPLNQDTSINQPVELELITLRAF